MCNLAPDVWDSALNRFPDAHLLQTSPWGYLKASFGWDVFRVWENNAGAQVLFRRLPLGVRLAYVPMGPVGQWLPDLLPRLDDVCRNERAIALKVEPDAAFDHQQAKLLLQHGFRPSPHTIQPPRTLVIDLRGEEDQILARMLQKTRYNIRLSSRKGVNVHTWDDPEAFGEMVQRTAARNRFGAHTPEYYRKAFELFHPQGGCELLLAEADGQPLASIMVFARGARAWYLYGASTHRKRNWMPTYLLQWEAIRWARARGCTSYDLWGIPDADYDTLEDEFASRSDGLWGVYRFKRGFGGQIYRSMGAWDRPYHKPLYAMYRILISRRAE